MSNQQIVPLKLKTPFGSIEVSLDEQLKYPERFFAWIVDHWDLYREFVERARNAKAWGSRSWGAKAIFESIRYDHMWQSRLRKNQSSRQNKKRDPFALNNNFTAGCARLAMRQFPELEGFFRCRDRLGMDEKAA